MGRFLCGEGSGWREARRIAGRLLTRTADGRRRVRFRCSRRRCIVVSRRAAGDHNLRSRHHRLEVKPDQAYVRIGVPLPGWKVTVCAVLRGLRSFAHGAALAAASHCRLQLRTAMGAAIDAGGRRRHSH